MNLNLNVSPKLLERVAKALEGIETHLCLIAPPPPEYIVPDKPMGREAVSYLDEYELWETEQKEKIGATPQGSQSDLP